MLNAPVYHSPKSLTSAVNAPFVVVMQNKLCNLLLDAFGNEVISQQQVNATGKNLSVFFALRHQSPYPCLVIGVFPAVFFEESV